MTFALTSFTQPKCTSCLFCLLPSTPAWKEFLQKASRKMIRVVKDGPFGSLHKHLKGIERLSNSLKHALQYDGDAMNLCKKRTYRVLQASQDQALFKVNVLPKACHRVDRERPRTTWTVATLFRILVVFPPRSEVSLGIASSE